jgi:ABC-2 type transport system permease protein
MTPTTTTVPVLVPAGGLAPSLRAVKIVWQRELIRFSKDRVRAVASLLQPILNLFVMGAGMASMTKGSGINLQTFMFPGIIAMAVMFTAVFSAGSIVMDREFGFLREMLVAPVPRTAILIGKCLGGATTSTLQGVLLLALAHFVGVPYDPLLMLELVGICLLLSFTLTAFGLCLASGMKSMPAFMGVVQLLIMPLFFLSGAMFPLGNLPAWLSVLTKLNPLTYAIDPMRRLVLEAAGVPEEVRASLGPGVTWGDWLVPMPVEIGVIAAFGVVLLAVAVAQFRRVE